VVWSRARVLFGKQLVDILAKKLALTETSVWLNSQVIGVNRAERRLTVLSPERGKVDIKAEAVLFACGAREETRSERGWIAGHRPARQFFTMQLLQLLDEHGVTPTQRSMIIGSDLIAYSAAAKLVASGADVPELFDHSPGRRASLLARFYFSRWARPVWHRVEEVDLRGSKIVEHLKVGKEKFACDGVVISGGLVPNDELLKSVGLCSGRNVRMEVRDRNEAVEPGWFVTGAEVGGFRSASWCCRDGRRAARTVAKFLS